jgi:hypothetical protein
LPNDKGIFACYPQSNSRLRQQAVFLIPQNMPTKSTITSTQSVLNGETPYTVLMTILKGHVRVEQAKQPFLVKGKIKIIL